VSIAIDWVVEGAAVRLLWVWRGVSYSGR
jgi:hypothetical protein